MGFTQFRGISKAKSVSKVISLIAFTIFLYSPRLVYVTACIIEAMRYSPFLALPPARKASDDIVCEEFTIPKGACIFYNLYAVFHDPSYWGDPEIYRPERLLDESKTQLDPKKLERISAFGFGS